MNRELQAIDQELQQASQQQVDHCQGWEKLVVPLPDQMQVGVIRTSKRLLNLALQVERSFRLFGHYHQELPR